MKRTITIDVDKVIDLLIRWGICVEVPQENEAEAISGPSDGVYIEPVAEEPAAEPAIEDIPLEQIQKKVVDLCAAGKKAEARAVIQEHGSKVSDLVTSEQRTTVWAKLTALEG